MTKLDARHSLKMAPQRSSGTREAAEEWRSHRRRPITLLAVVFASALFSVTSWFAHATFSDSSITRTQNALEKLFKGHVGNTLTVLSILQGLLSIVMGFVLDAILESIQWSLTSRNKGSRILTALGLSPTTSIFGTIGILFGRKAKGTDRCWGCAKYGSRPNPVDHTETFIQTNFTSPDLVVGCNIVQ
jgi:hypothetical protein